MPMNPDKWTLRDWILRGLVASCLSRRRLYDWYVDNVDEPETDRRFDKTVSQLWEEGLVYIQRQVECSAHPECPGKLAGFSLTDRGIAAERELWEWEERSSERQTSNRQTL